MRNGAYKENVADQNQFQFFIHYTSDPYQISIFLYENVRLAKRLSDTNWYNKLNVACLDRHCFLQNYWFVACLSCLKKFVAVVTAVVLDLWQ